MKALAASNIGQYERAVAALQKYYRTVELAVRACSDAAAPAPPAASNHIAKRTRRIIPSCLAGMFVELSILFLVVLICLNLSGNRKLQHIHL